MVKLLPYSCDMNPIKCAWSDIKNYVHKNNMMGLKWLIILTAKGVVSMTQKTGKVTSGMWETEQQY